MNTSFALVKIHMEMGNTVLTFSDNRITFLFDVLLILRAENLCWSLVGVKGIMPLDGKKKMAITPKS